MCGGPVFGDEWWFDDGSFDGFVSDDDVQGATWFSFIMFDVAHGDPDVEAGGECSAGDDPYTCSFLLDVAFMSGDAFVSALEAGHALEGPLFFLFE